MWWPSPTELTSAAAEHQTTRQRSNRSIIRHSACLHDLAPAELLFTETTGGGGGVAIQKSYHEEKHEASTTLLCVSAALRLRDDVTSFQPRQQTDKSDQDENRCDVTATPCALT